MKWSREKYIELMTFGHTERQMFSELFGPLIGLEQEWLLAGAAQNEIGMSCFDFDYVPTVHSGGNTEIFGGHEPCFLSETEDFTFRRDELGRTIRIAKGAATIGLPVDYPVSDMDSWLKIKHMYEFTPERINLEQIEKAKNLQAQRVLVTAGIPGGFDLPRNLMGEEALCFAYYDQPELISDIMETVTKTSLRVLDEVSDEILIDNLCVHEDMAGKTGPLIGPEPTKQYIAPYYKSVWEMLSSKGTKLFSQDSDGNIDPLLDIFMEAGVNVVFPLEPAAGMDMVALRKKYGAHLAFKGGIDKHVLRGTKDEILKELTYKLQPVMQEGGTVFGIDHRITNGTPLENYKYYVDTTREMLGLPPLDADSRGWGRMAF